jgi:hypothetical protein
MRISTTFRCLTNWVTLMAFAVGALQFAAAQGPRRLRRAQIQAAAPASRSQSRPPQGQPAPIVRQPPPGREMEPARAGASPGRVPQQGHLAQWMNQHSNLTPAEQMQALQREPGFRELPQQTQQRYMNRLGQLNAMPLQQRQRLLASNEAMEKLTADQRAQVRGAMQQLGGLPEDQRGAALNSERYRGQLNPQQMETLRGLMRVEPMLPPPEPRPGQGQRPPDSF